MNNTPSWRSSASSWRPWGSMRVRTCRWRVESRRRTPPGTGSACANSRVRRVCARDRRPALCSRASCCRALRRAARTARPSADAASRCRDARSPGSHWYTCGRHSPLQVRLSSRGRRSQRALTAHSWWPKWPTSPSTRCTSCTARAAGCCCGNDVWWARRTSCLQDISN